MTDEQAIMLKVGEHEEVTFKLEVVLLLLMMFLHRDVEASEFEIHGLIIGQNRGMSSWRAFTSPVSRKIIRLHSNRFLPIGY